MKYLFLLVVLLLSCEIKEPKPVICVHQESQEYNLGISKWDTKILKYYIKDPEQIDKFLVKEIANMYSEHTGMFIVPSTIEEYDIIISIEEMDGFGGVLGRSWLPPATEHSIYPVPIHLDRADVTTQEGKKAFDLATIIAHEMGHALGLLHSSLFSAVMADKYKKHPSLGLDDILALRKKYNVTTPFLFDDVNYIWVNKGSTKKVSEHFTEGEFATTCEHLTGNYIAEDLITVAQILREEYGPIKINSTFRDEDCNFEAGGAAQSKHQLANAFDGTILAVKGSNLFRRDIKNKKCIYHTLDAFNVHGIGIYDKHIHLDIRNGNFSIWSGVSKLENN